MGESYKGLTIRIGADTGNLQKALTVVTAAAKTAQNQLTRMNRALKLDPGSLDTSSAQLKALGNRAETAAMRVTQLKAAYRQLDGSEMRKLSQETENAGLKAAEALAQYNRMDASLEKVKTALNGLAGKDIFDGADTERELADLRQLGTEAEKLVSKYERLHSSWQDAFDANESAKAVAKFQDLEVEIASAEASLRAFNAQLAKGNAEQYAREAAQGFSEAALKVQSLDERAQALESELRQLETALRLDPSNVELVKARFGNLKEQAELADERVKALKEQISSMRSSGIDAAGKSMGELSAGAQKAQAAFEKVTSELTSAKGALADAESALNRFQASGEESASDFKLLSDRVQECKARVSALAAEEGRLGSESALAQLAVDAKQAETRMAALGAEAASLNAKITETSRVSSIGKSALLSIGMSAQTIITPMMERMGEAMVESAEEIDSAYRSMRKTVQGTEDEFSTMLALAKEYSSTNFTSTDTILSIEAMGGQLGIATENLNDFAVAISNIDIATNIDADTASEDLGQMANILSDLTEDKFGSFSDAIVRLGNNNATLESNIMDVAQRIGSMGSILGMTTPQVLAWSTAIASTGQNSEAAGTAISNTMSDMETAVSKGGESLQGFADVAGMSAEEFAAKWKSSPSEAMQAFVNGLAEVTEKGGSADGTLQSLGITGVRQKQALLGLAQTTDTLANSLVMSNDAWNGVSDAWGQAGDAANEAAQKSEGFSGKLQILQNNVQNAVSEFGDGLIPVMEMATDAIGAATTAFEGMSTEAKTAVIVLGAGASAFGPVATAISAVQGALDDLGDRSKQAGKQWNSLVRQQSASSTKLSDVGKAVRASFESATLAETANAVALRAQGAAASAAAAKQALLNAAVSAARFTPVALGATALVAAIVAVTKAAADATDGTSQYTAATKESEAAVTRAQAAYESAVAAHGAESDEALTAAASLSQERAAFESSKETIGEFAERVDDACKSHEELMDSISKRTGDANEQAGSIMLLAQRIASIAESSDDAASKSSQLSGMIEQLNTSCSGLNLTFDEQTGALSMTTDALQAYASAQASEIKGKAALENYNDLLKESVTLQETAADATANLEAFEAQYGLTLSDSASAVMADTNQLDVNAKARAELEKAAKDAQQAVEENADAQAAEIRKLTEATKASSALSEAVSKCGGDTSKAAQAAQDASEKWGTYVSEAEVSAQIAAEQTQKQQELAEALQDSVDELGEYAESSPAFASALQSSGYSVSDLAQKLSDAGIETSTFTSEVESMCSKTQDMFSQMEQQGDISIDEMIANLQANIETTSSWKDNITALYGMAGSDSEKAFVDSLSQLGPEYNNALDTIIASDRFGELAALWSQGGEEAVSAYIQSMLGMSGEVQSAGGSNADAGAEGASGKQGEYTQAAQGNVDAMNQVMESNYGKAKALGEANGSNFAAGLWSKTGEASSAGSAVVSAAISALSGGSETAYQWGSHLGSNFAAGLWSKMSEAGEAASDVASAAAESLQFTVPKKGVWSGAEKGGWRSGTHLVQNFAQGVEDGIPQLSKAVARAASAAASSLSTGDYRAAVNLDTANSMKAGLNVTVADSSLSALAGVKEELAQMRASLPEYAQATAAGASEGSAAILAALPSIIAENAPNLVIDNDAGRMVVDSRLNQLRRKAAMNRG